jgi:acyl-coenzyme A thioesterase PaaI-like protein
MTLLKETALVRAFALAKIPMLFFVGPKVQRLDPQGCAVLLPLGFRTKNHLGSMYFGALCAGADMAGGLNAADAIFRRHKRVNLIFKDFRAEYLKRADGDVLFRCEQGEAIYAAVARADHTGERITLPVEVTATVPDRYGDEPVARFTLGLSLKRQ